MSQLFQPLEIGQETMKNRFMLAPLTNCQSNDDGTLSDEEFKWLTMRAEGGFGLTMTCAAHVQAVGRGFPGQLGIFGDNQLDGLTRLASAIKSHDSIAIAQLHHAGMRSPHDLIEGPPVSASDDEETGSRALSTDEVKQVITDFISAAIRAERAGFDGVELHGAHGYLICQFLSSEINHRTDEYGGTLDNRARVLTEIIDGIRDNCASEFLLGVRLSPERFGMDLTEIKTLSEQIMLSGNIDFLDISLWDSFKEPNEEAFKGTSLLSHFANLDRGDAKLGVAGKISTPSDAEEIMSQGVDWIMLGRAAIINHDFPNQQQANPDFTPTALPVSPSYLNNEGLSDNFVEYMRRWKGFVTD